MTITSNNAILQRTIVSDGVMYIFRQVVIGSSFPANPKQQVLYIVDSVMKYWNGSLWTTLGGGSAVWGGITGTLSNQTDLQNALNAKVNANNVLAKDNTTVFNPDADYEPSTKKYVDDIAITKVDKVTGKQLSTEDYTTAEKSKLTGIEAAAQVNIIETVKVNNVALTPTAKAVDIQLKTINGTAIEGTGDITISGGLDKTFQTLTEAATITFDASVSVNASVTLTASRILGNITNAVQGEIHCVKVIQGSAGSYTLTYGNQYKFGGGLLPILSSTVGAVDLLFFLAVSTTEFHFINANFDVKTP